VDSARREALRPVFARVFEAFFAFDVVDFEEAVERLADVGAGSAWREVREPREKIAAKAAAEIPNRLCTDGIIRTDRGWVNPKSSWDSIIYARSA
jgi:hypothetical protein